MSPLRRSGKPIKSVSLRVEFRANEKTIDKIVGRVPAARRVRGGCVVLMEGESPTSLSERARELSEIVRDSLKAEKDFKEQPGSRRKNEPA